MATRKFYRQAKKKFSFLRFSYKTLKISVIGGFIFVLGVFAYCSKDLPSPKNIDQKQFTQSTKIYDRTGQVLLYDIHGEEKRTVVDFGKIPEHIKQATLAAEDNNFYNHFGLDFRALLRAILIDIRGGLTGGSIKQQGASTITQQFIKNAILTPEKTFTRKIKEAILSIELEIKYSKDEIFSFYLNQIPYGSNAYGVEAASLTFFNKHVWETNLAEAAILASLPKAPSYYWPYGQNPEALKERQEYILDRMAELGYISEEDAQKAKEEEIKYSSKKTGIKAPHFVMYVKEYINNKYGEDYVEKAGLRIYTTLDWDLQKAAEEVVEEIAVKNETKYNAYNAALVSIDPKTGQILAMVGSKDYFGDSYPKGCKPGKNCLFEPNVNVSIRDRQPGSSFKPFAYSMAFKKGFTPSTVLFDVSTEFGASGKSYQPQNYDGREHGYITMKEALAQSLNIPAVKTLYLAGINETINMAQDMGITTLKDRSRYGLSLVLGGGEVKLIDETSAFGVFAADGVKNNKTPILKIETEQGEVLEEYREDSVRILDKQIAYQINDILSDNNARAPIFGAENYLTLGDRPVAAKTGTTQEYRDAWTIGYTPSLVTGVWVGNNNNKAMYKGDGSAAAAPIWNKFMKEAYLIKSGDDFNTKTTANYFSLPPEKEYFTPPNPPKTDKSVLNGKFANEITVKIDKISQKLATELTPPELIEERIYKEVHTILYYVDKNNPQGAQPSNPGNDPQFENWESAVLNWIRNNPTPGESYNQPLPTEYDDIHTMENQPIINIQQPAGGQTFKCGDKITVRAEVDAPLTVKQVDFFAGNNLISSFFISPYKTTYRIDCDDIEKPGGNEEYRELTIKIRAYDTALNKTEKEIILKIENE